MLLGIDYLHRKGFIHRSIRASHILINQSKAVLSGFRETSALMTHGQRTRLLFDLPPHSTKSLKWLAPEVLEQNLAGYSEKSDIYSVGITTCELANGLDPFAKMPTTFMLTEKMRGNQPALLDCSTCITGAQTLYSIRDSNRMTSNIISFAAPSGSTSDLDDSVAYQSNPIYGERKLSDHFHKFAEMCMER